MRQTENPERFLSWKSISLRLITVTLAASISIPAVEEKPAQVPASVTSQTPISASRQFPQLPEGLAAMVVDREKEIDRVLSQPDKMDAELYSQLIKVAEAIVQARETYQGAGWWQSMNARRRLSDLRLISGLSGEQRSKLAQARGLNAEYSKLSSEGRLEEALQLAFRICEICREILGENHPYYVTSLNNVAYCLQSLGRAAEALPKYEAAFEIFQGLFKGDHPDVAISLNNVAYCLDALGRSAEALPKYEAALAMRERLFQGDHPDVANSLNNVAACLHSLGRAAEALPRSEAALLMYQRLFKGDHPDVALSLNNVAACLEALGRAAEALPKYVAALEMYQRLVQGDHPRVALSLNNVAYCLQVLGRAAEALPKYEAALAMRERLLKGDHPDVANSLNNVADCLRSLGLAEEALPRYEAALEMYQRLFKGDHPDVALSLNNVALCLQSLGRAAEALPKCEAALEMYQRLFKGDHPQVALGLNNVAYCLQSLGRAAEALPQFEAALEMYRRVFKGDHPDVAMSLNNGAYSLESLGRSAEALPRYEAALEMYQRLFKGDHPDVALSLNNVALCLQSLGRAAEALPKCEAALEMYKRLFKGDHPAAAQTLNNVAFCLQSLGRSAEALPKFEEALKMRQRLFKGDHPDVAESLNNVAYCLDSLGTTTEALPKSEASLEMYQRLFRGDHPQVASSLNNVAHQLQALGRIPEALPKYEAALEMYQRLFKGDHPDVAMSLNNVAVCLGSLGRTAEALTKNEAALEMYRRLYEGSHPALAMSLTNNALMLAELGMHDKAVGVFLESVQVQWDCLTRNFPTLTSQQKQQYLTSTRSVQTEALSGLIFEGKGLEAKDGLRGALLSKQLLFEAARQENGALLTASARALPEWLALWQERERLRRQYATSALQGLTEANRMQPPGHSVVNPAYVRELANRIEQLEQRLRQGNPAYALEARLQQVTLEDVTAALRPGEALIEYIGYHPYDFVLRKWGSARYGAFILLGGAGQVAAVDLGEADGIDQAAKRFRMEVAGSIEKFRGVFPSRGQVRNSEREIGQASSALRGLVWKPLEKHLSGIRRVYVAPEGILGLVPFEALAKEDASGGWRYLAEECELVYLGTARDLGRLALSIPGKGERPNTAVLIGNPAFSAPSQRLAEIVAGLKPTGKQVAQLSSQAGSFLLGADSSAEPRRVEVPRNWPQNLELAQMIVRVRGWLEKLGWSVTTLTNLSAVEEAAQRVQAPRILQFATHGYLLNRPATNLQGWDNPLLRSMLLMAGVNTWQRSSSVFYWVGGRVLTEAQARTQSLSEAEMQAARIELADGILTAYEVTGMNLHGTELVNLTACETGLGEVTPDGVAGLRQAFLLAGTRALTMSMWEVPAEETTGQIVDFYDRWLSGNKSGQPTTRYGAFRAAQLAALARARREYGAGHPFYWAGVVFVGDPGDLPASSEQRPIDKSISGKQ